MIPLPRIRRVALDAIDLALTLCGLLRSRRAPELYERASKCTDALTEIGELRLDLVRQKRRAADAEDEARRWREKARGAS